MNLASPSPADDPRLAEAEDTNADDAVASSTPASRKRIKRVELFQDLLRSIDALIYIELSALYYLDCAFALFIVRTLVQLFVLTERPPGLPHAPTRSALGAVVGSNLLCILSHLVNARPQAGEATRNYLHGSILIDFVGQLGPTSKWRLFYMDTLVLVLQALMLGLEIRKRKVQNAEEEIPGPAQDLEAEEAGIVRSERMRDGLNENDVGIEMEELLPAGTSEHEAGRDDSNIHPLDEFYTGEFILTRLDVVGTILEDVTGVATSSEATLGGLSLPGLFLRWRSLG